MKRNYFFLLFPVLFYFSNSDFNLKESSVMCQIDVGVDLYLELGTSTELEVFISCPEEQITSISWTPTNGLSCTDCLTAVSNPLEDVCYTITVNWDDGTSSTDEVCLFVDDCGPSVSESSIVSLSSTEIETDANFTVEINRRQYAYVEVLQDGEVVEILREGWFGEGQITWNFDFSSLSAGAYILQLRLFDTNLTTPFEKI